MSSLRPDLKQVIVVRRDLKMPKGKLAVQAAHASSGILRMHLVHTTKPSPVELAYFCSDDHRKVCVGVDTEEELMLVYGNAAMAGFPVYLVTDFGLTCFKGLTRTCCAIGPGIGTEIDVITGHLGLL